jgi:tetratricopeptide (TPR) repeat protein
VNRRRDRRLLGVLLTAALVLFGGAWLARIDPTHAPQAPTRGDELRQRFDAAVLLLHSKQYEPAAAALQRVLELAPRLTEAHVNMGFALLGLQRPAAARAAFDAAIGLKADQANAYYGLAMAHEGLGDLELAIGAMRSYLHLARAEDEAHLRRARAALWEWETKLAGQRAAKRP